MSGVRVKAKYLAVLADYLLWIPEGSIFLQPPLMPFAEDGPSAAQWMKQWESSGIRARKTSEPVLLQRYMQGKTCRDWHITEWREGIEMGLFFPLEFVGTLGITSENVTRILGPDRRFA